MISDCLSQGSEVFGVACLHWLALEKLATPGIPPSRPAAVATKDMHFSEEMNSADFPYPVE
eukprot:3916063-Lingulodinium_polyedra.AAC.1